MDKKISVSELHEIYSVKVEKVINVSLQESESDLEKIIEFNKQNNYEYIIRYDEQNLVDSNNIIQLIKSGYIVSRIDNSLIFKHTKYSIEK